MNGLVNWSYCQRYELLNYNPLYCAFTAGSMHKVTYIMRTIPDICQHLQKLDQYVENVVIPALVDGHIPTRSKLLSLTVKVGGMEIVIFADIVKTEFQNPKNVTESLTKDQLAKFKYNVKKEKLQRNTKRLQSLSINKTCLSKIKQKKGASTWLSTLPLKEEGYNLLKQEFWDLVKIRYEWPLLRLSNMCSEIWS